MVTTLTGPDDGEVDVRALKEIQAPSFLFAVGKSVMVKLSKTPSNCSIDVGCHMCICIFVHSTFCII